MRKVEVTFLCKGLQRCQFTLTLNVTESRVKFQFAIQLKDIFNSIQEPFKHCLNMFILVFRGPLRQRKGHYSNGKTFFKELGLIKAAIFLHDGIFILKGQPFTHAIFKFIYVRNFLDIAVIKWQAVYMHDIAVATQSATKFASRCCDKNRLCKGALTSLVSQDFQLEIEPCTIFLSHAFV